LIEDDAARNNKEDNDIGKSNETLAVTAAKKISNDIVSLRQRYTLSTLWF
jgi:hypothetical protein